MKLQQRPGEVLVLTETVTTCETEGTEIKNGKTTQHAEMGKKTKRGEIRNILYCADIKLSRNIRSKKNC